MTIIQQNQISNRIKRIKFVLEIIHHHSQSFKYQTNSDCSSIIFHYQEYQPIIVQKVIMFLFIYLPDLLARFVLLSILCPMVGQLNLLLFKERQQSFNIIIIGLILFLLQLQQSDSTHTNQQQQMSSPSQLFSCVDANAILRSPVNTSTAKNHWSFSKGDRFPNYRVYCDAIYDIPTTKSRRKAGFGYGKKTDLQVGKNRHNITPPPNSYDLATFIQSNKMHGKGYSPGKGRDQVAPVSYIPLQPYKMPGPGTYSPNKSADTPYWSMRPRTSSQLFPKTTQKIVPGPGRYQSCQNLSQVGKYYTTKHSNSRSKVWNPKSSKRFNKSTTDVPGPGTYRPKNDLSAQGDYVLSKNNSAGHRKLLLGPRDSFVDQDHKRILTPGPGTYRLPSDFGHYDQIAPFTARSSVMGKTTSRSKFISDKQK